MDDTFTALPQEQIQLFHDKMNSIEPTIQFTIETEVEGTLPFLDTMVTRHVDGSLTTSVFRKKTHTDRYLDFNSHNPLVHKIALARTLLTQADRICVSMPDRDAEKRHITQALYSNGYPTRVIKRNWQTPPARSPASDPVMPRATVVIPYVRHVSESIRRILTPLEIRTAFAHIAPTANTGEPKGPHPTTTTGRCSLQDPLWHISGVYVGQTCRTLDHRLKEHKRAITSGNLAQSAVAEHAAHESHVINWKEAKVVDTHPRYHQRCALESWHIRSETTTMNRDDGSLPQAYNTLLNYPRKPHTPH